MSTDDLREIATQIKGLPTPGKLRISADLMEQAEQLRTSNPGRARTLFAIAGNIVQDASRALTLAQMGAR